MIGCEVKQYYDWLVYNHNRDTIENNRFVPGASCPYNSELNTKSELFQIWGTMPIKACGTNCKCALCTLHVASVDPNGSL